ncbi:hypothetical protein E4U45_007133 [Claviceps purpurea]|nr:hypothetical protein E4U45_007133 [Claviceps purpurea]
MYASKTVCVRCASRLRLAVSLTHTHRSVAWFSSAADSAPELEATDTQHSQRSSRPSFTSHRLRSDSGPFRRPRRSLDHTPTSALALFNQVVQRSSAPSDDTPPSAGGGSDDNVGAASSAATDGLLAPTASTYALTEWETTAKLTELNSNALDPQEKLRIFEENIWPQIKKLRCRAPKTLYMNTISFLVSICDAAAEKGLLRVSLTVSSMLATMGKWDLDRRIQLILNLCHVLATAEETEVNRGAVVAELLEMWKHVSQLRRRSLALRREDRPVNQFMLPELEDIREDIERVSISSAKKSARATDPVSAHKSPTTRALANVFTQYELMQVAPLIPGLLATLAVLSDARVSDEASQVKAARLLRPVSAALKLHPANEAYIRAVFATGVLYPAAKLSELESYVVAQWPSVMTMLSSKHLERRPGRSGPWRHDTLQRFQEQVRRAYRTRNPEAVMSVWQNLKRQVDQHPALAQQLHDDPEFFDYWSFVWCAMQRLNNLQDTLDMMRQLHIQPTMRTYTSMMHGWKICKDVRRIEALWEKIMKSRMKPDAHIWTERISALIETGNPQAGLRALAEMYRTWTEALARSDGNAEKAATIAVQPSMEVVNAALKGILSIDRDAANDLLKWASNQGLEADTTTFNIFLRQSLRTATHDVAGVVESLLKAMKERGLEPDGATFTIVLEDLLGGMHGATADEQVQAVQQILSDMETAGLKPNREAYAKMLYAISSLPYGGAEAAIAAVQKHMAANGVTETPHMVTILLERALVAQSSPLDSGDKIRAFLHKHRLRDISQGDRTLWERIMGAYASAGDLRAAVNLFGQLARTGRPVTSLPCLESLLRALTWAADQSGAGPNRRRSSSSSSAEDGEEEYDDGGGEKGDVNKTANSLGLGDTKGVDYLADAREVVRVVLNYYKSAHLKNDLTTERVSRSWRHHFWYLAMEYSLLDWEVVPPELRRVLKGEGEGEGGRGRRAGI